MIRAFERLSRELRRRVMLMIGRAVLRVVTDSQGLQIVQVEGFRGEVIDDAERMQPYGFTSHPHPGADALVLSVGGMRQHSLVLIDDRRHRLHGLAEGEVAIYTSRDDQHIKLLANGGIEIRGTDINIVSNSLTHNGVCIGDDHVHGGIRRGSLESDGPECPPIP